MAKSKSNKTKTKFPSDSLTSTFGSLFADEDDDNNADNDLAYQKGDEQDGGSDEEPKSILERHPDILEMRFNGRKIPKVDDGFAKNDLTDDALKRFYHNARVDEFLKFVSSNGKRMIKFEFGKMLDGYAIDTDDKDENQMDSDSDSSSDS